MPSFLSKEPKNESRKRWRKRYDTPEAFARNMRNMYRMATEVDDVCGDLVAELKRRDLYDDTLVIFTADNGNLHGEHGLADKWYPHEESVRVPLVVRDPRAPPRYANTTNDDFVLNVDLAPTILSAAGLTPNTAVMQGRDAAELYLRRPSSDDDHHRHPYWRDEFYYEHPSIMSSESQIPASEALIRKDYKLFSWPHHNQRQLFHVASDPAEEHDLLAEDGDVQERHAEIASEMRARMKQLRIQAHFV